jgi:hypothetical protein
MPLSLFYMTGRESPWRPEIRVVPPGSFSWPPTPSSHALVSFSNIALFRPLEWEE